MLKNGKHKRYWIHLLKLIQMMVEPVESETADINDVRTLIDYLNMMTVQLEF